MKNLDVNLNFLSEEDKAFKEGVIFGMDIVLKVLSKELPKTFYKATEEIKFRLRSMEDTPLQ